MEATESGVAVRCPYRGQRQRDRRISPEDDNGCAWGTVAKVRCA